MKSVLNLIAVTLFLGSVCASARGKHHRHNGRHGARHHKSESQPVTSEICPSGEPAKRTQLTNYYTPVISVARCDNGKNGLVNYNSHGRNGEACEQSMIDKVVKRIEGAAVVLSSTGTHMGVLVSPMGPLQEILNSGLEFSENPPPGTPDGMMHVSGVNCPLGYGSKIDGQPVCLDPFKTVACSSQHAIGDLVYIPALVGIKYPRYPGQPKLVYETYKGHDGYFSCGDIGSAIQGEHIDLFVGLINPYSEANPFRGFSNTKRFGVCWVPREDPEKRYLFHTAVDLNASFPQLSPGTLGNYLNAYLLAKAFTMNTFWNWVRD